MPQPSVVFITAHPDDVAFSCGGTAWKLSRTYDTHVICATRGDGGHIAGRPDATPEEVAEVRAAEEQANCDILGASLTFLELNDGNIFADREACGRVAMVLADIKPVAVLTHGPFEKKDHSATFSIAWQALHLADRFWETEVCMFFHENGTYNLTSPSILVDISDVVDKKREQIRCHASHHENGEKDVEALLERNRTLGRMTFAEYAEAFYSPFPMVNRRWGRKPECGRILLEL